MRFSIFGVKRERGPTAAAHTNDNSLATLRVSSGRLNPERSLGRRDRDFAFHRIYVPTAILDVSVLWMRQSGTQGEERFLLWAGTVSSGEAHVATVVMPRAKSGQLHGEIPADVVGRVLEALDSRDLVPIAQIHSHPRQAFLSNIDRKRPLVSVPGFLSIIVPDFAFVDADAVDAWAVYEFRGHNQWRELAAAEKQDRIVLDQSLLRID